MKKKSTVKYSRARKKNLWNQIVTKTVYDFIPMVIDFSSCFLIVIIRVDFISAFSMSFHVLGQTALVRRFVGAELTSKRSFTSVTTNVTNQSTKVMTWIITKMAFVYFLSCWMNFHVSFQMLRRFCPELTIWMRANLIFLFRMNFLVLSQMTFQFGWISTIFMWAFKRPQIRVDVFHVASQVTFSSGFVWTQVAEKVRLIFVVDELMCF